jgi:hypothetical protein
MDANAEPRAADRDALKARFAALKQQREQATQDNLAHLPKTQKRKHKSAPRSEAATPSTRDADDRFRPDIVREHSVEVRLSDRRRG